jgi:hypothetical protein
LDTTKEWGPSTDIATIVDTCLLKSYIRTGNNLVSSLLRVHNCCHVGECASVLIGERVRYSTRRTRWRPFWLTRFLCDE